MNSARDGFKLGGMKRRFILPGFFVLFGWSVLGQDAAGIAAKQGADERYERMSADIQSLQTANEALLSKVSALEQEVSDLRAQQAQVATSTNLQDDLKELAEKIEEVDRKREEDKQAISEEIRKSIAGLEKSIGAAGVSHIAPQEQSPGSEPVGAENGFVYTVQEGDSLLAIIKAYNKDFKSKGLKPITLSQAMDANPKTDWNRMRVGQKIVIPRPEQ